MVGDCRQDVERNAEVGERWGWFSHRRSGGVAERLDAVTRPGAHRRLITEVPLGHGIQRLFVLADGGPSSFFGVAANDRGRPSRTKLALQSLSDRLTTHAELDRHRPYAPPETHRSPDGRRFRRFQLASCVANRPQRGRRVVLDFVARRNRHRPTVKPRCDTELASARHLALAGTPAGHSGFRGVNHAYHLSTESRSGPLSAQSVGDNRYGRLTQQKVEPLSAWPIGDRQAR